LHFGPPYAPAVGEALLRIAPELRPDVVVASGDFTQRAKAAQFAEARAFLDRLPRVPLVTVPGNHDIPLYRVFERLWTPYAHYRRYISPQLDCVMRRDNAVIVALNTTAPLSAVTNGQIRRWQLDFCADAFRDAPSEAARIVVAHHHFAPAPDYDNEHDVMRRAKAALDLFSELKVDLIMGGHFIAPILAIRWTSIRARAAETAS
jgi:3',5'-cyclic AMP phosphodiesterase CpdA